MIIMFSFNMCFECIPIYVEIRLKLLTDCCPCFQRRRPGSQKNAIQVEQSLGSISTQHSPIGLSRATWPSHWLVWLIDECKNISNSFRTSNRRLTRGRMQVSVPKIAQLFTFACRTRRSHHTQLNGGQLSAAKAGWRGCAPSPGGQQSATVTGSIYPLCPWERSSGRGQPLSRHACVSVHACVWARNAEGAIWRTLEATASLTW